MSFFHVVILGVIEGLTEFLPISSTAHLMMSSKILHLAQSNIVKNFEIVIQAGAISAILTLYGKMLFQKGNLWLKVLASFIPTGIIGFLLYNLIKKDLVGNLSIAIIALIIGSWGLIGADWFSDRTIRKQKVSDPKFISFPQAIIIGIIQSIAVIPGISRAAASIVPAMFLNIDRKTAVEFSFLLSIPTVLAASGYDIFKNQDILNTNLYFLITGFIVSFITALFAVRFFISYVKNHSLTLFAGYRIIIAIVFFIFFL